MRALAFILVAAALALVQVPHFTCHDDCHVLHGHGHGGPDDDDPCDHAPGEHTIVFQHAGTLPGSASLLGALQLTADLPWLALPAMRTDAGLRTIERSAQPPGPPLLETVHLLL